MFRARSCKLGGVIRRPTRRRGAVWMAVLFLLLAVVPPDAAAQDTLTSAAEVDFPPFSIVQPDGTATGFAVELLRSAIAAMGREVTFRTGPWSDVRSLLERGEVDVLPLVGRTPEREHLFDFTFPYMSLHGVIVVRDDTTGITDVESLHGRRVAVMAGDNAEEYLRREDRGIDIRTTATFDQALRELAAGFHDAVVMQRLVALRLVREIGTENLRLIDRPIDDFRQDFSFAVRIGDRETLALVNEGLAVVIADGTFRSLHARWFAALELPADRRIVVGGDRSFPPYEYLDRDGNPVGYAVDLTRAIARELGLEVTIRLGPWGEIRRMLERGEIDAVQGMLYSPERERLYDFAPSHTVVNYVSVARRGERQPPTAAAGLDGLRVVVQTGDIMHDYALEHGLSATLVTVDSQEDALRALAAGEHDVALVARNVALYWIERHGWTNLAVGRTPLLSPGFAYAAAKGRQALVAELSDGLSGLRQTGEYRRIYETWMGVYETRAPGVLVAFRYVGMVAGPLGLTALLALLWVKSLRSQVARQTVELKEREGKYRLLADHSLDVIWAMHLDLRFTYVNPACLRTVGYLPGELIGTRLEDLCTPEAYRVMTDNVRESLEAGPPGDGVIFETELIRKDGSSCPVEILASVLCDDAGTPVGFQGIARDITQRRREAEVLKDREDRLRSLFAAAPVGIGFVVGRVIMEANGTLLLMTGYCRDELVGRDAGILYPTEAEYAAVGVDKHAQMQDSGTGTVETRWRQKNGEIIDVLLRSTYLDPADPGKGATFTALDITERNRALASLRDVHAELSAIHQSAPIGMVLLDGDRRLREAHLGEDRSGGGRDQEAGAVGDAALRCLNALLDPRGCGFTADCSACRVRTAVLGTFADHASRQAVETWLPVADQERPGQRCIRFWTSFLRVGGEERVLFCWQDVTDQRLLEQQLRQAQKMDAIGRLAGGVAHDYNNMLSVILWRAQHARDLAGTDSDLIEDLDEILRAADRSTAITRQLLAFARKEPVNPEVIDLNRTIERMLLMLRRLIGEHIELSWRPDDHLWPVRVDAAQVDQIMVNLCLNARDSIDGAGRITVETRNATLDERFCAVHTGFVPGEYGVLSIRDDGAGMSEEVRAHLFEPFYTTKALGHGTGLGLATVYGIVKQNDGFIDTRSVPGRGTTFTVYLPRDVTGEADADVGVGVGVGVYPAPPDGAGLTVLLVEDEAAVRRMAVMMLERLGYDVLVADSPGEALRLAEAHSGMVDVLVTDVVMPEMNGRELSEQLTLRYPGLRTLYMSGYTADVITHRGVLDPGVQFIQKPFSLSDLDRSIRETLDSSA